MSLGGLVAEVTPESVERLAIRPGVKVVAVWKATASRAVGRDPAVRLEPLMRVVIAPDKLKGTYSAPEAAEALAAGWRSVRPGDDLVLVPMADGGEGTAAALLAARGGDWRAAAGPRCARPAVRRPVRDARRRQRGAGRRRGLRPVAAGRRPAAIRWRRGRTAPAS